MSKDIFDHADRFIASTYARFPIVLEKGEGSKVWDTDGKSYTDFLAGIAVCNLGHAHPEIAKALAEQAKTLVHVSNLYYTIPQTRVSEMLVKHSFADKVFFCNSGAEANEAAIKLARKHFQEKGESSRFKIIAMDQSFHGRTMATLSATGQEKIKKGFDPLLDGFEFIPFNQIQAVKEMVDSSTCAVITEPVQGEGGVNCPGAGYLKELRDICTEEGILLIFDEIQTGIGRTGKLFAYEHFGVEPDIMTLAKAIANGLPMGAMLAKESVASAFNTGSHASTFGGTPLVTAASLVVLRTVANEEFLIKCREKGEYFKARLEELKSKHSNIIEVRGLGLLLGIGLNTPGDTIVKKCLENGFLINCIQENILRFAPPLIVTKAEIDDLIDCLDHIFQRIE